MIKSIFIIFSGLLLFSCQTPNVDMSPASSFKIQEGFMIELMASEPLISDPVDMEIDELGRWFVVEMHGYPLDLVGSGVIKRLIDTDGDGYPDQSTVYADNLVLPTGIMRWKEGFLVTDPPNVLYLEDADDDGAAEIRDTILTGFARSNPQHNVNNPMYGLDNWIYLSHEGAVKSQIFDSILGDRGSVVHFPSEPDSDGLPQNANGLGVRFKPDTRELEMLGARCQFGQTFNSWGHHFQTNNATHLFHAAISASYLHRNPDLLISSGQQYLPKSGRGFDIFPITTNPDHQLLTDIGAMTSACGILWYQGDLFPPEYNQVIFTAEPVHNLIHADIIQEKGSTFESINLMGGSEFLASKDSWFRPVNHYVGPDGALYVLDYYRKIIEHPEWLSDEVINSGDLYQGNDQGRIYRISPVGSPPPDFVDNLDLKKMPADQLIDKLGSNNIWWRTQAQRLLIDRVDTSLVTQLNKFVLTTSSAVGKVHGLWLLEGLGSSKEKTLLTTLADSSPGVRENAIKIAEIHLTEFPQLQDHLINMVNDANPKVRYQLLLTLGESSDESAAEVRRKILLHDMDDDWVHYAALSARYLDVNKLYEEVAVALSSKQTEGGRNFITKLGQTMARKNNSQDFNLFLDKIFKSDKHSWFEAIVLNGINESLQQKGNFEISPSNLVSLAATFKDHQDTSIRSSSLDLLKTAGFFHNLNNPLLSPALKILEHDSSSESMRVDAIKIIGWTDADAYREELKSILVHSAMPGIRAAVLEAVSDADASTLSDFFISVWSDLLPPERIKAIAALLEDDTSKLILLEAIGKKQIQPASLNWPQTVNLLNSANPQIRGLARKELKGNELNADEVWQEYQKALELRGSSQEGVEIFKINCGICHQIRGKNGISFGPDLAAIQNRNKAAILLDILQPNKSIADGFDLCTVESNSGILFSGLISMESPLSITIKDPSGKEMTLDRSEIKSVKVSETSAMPENLQGQITVQEMADLLAYIKNE